MNTENNSEGDRFLEKKIDNICNRLSVQEKNQIIFNILSPLIIEHRFLPYMKYSMDYHSILILINDIVLNKRKSILEFGCGLSTILIARLIKRNELSDVKITSVEHDAQWLSFIQENLFNENLDDHVDLIYAPLDETSFIKMHNVPWYSCSCLDKELYANKFDMIIVDGPPAYNPEIALSRLPALYYIRLKKITADDFSIFIHDIDRVGEKQILRAWEAELKRKGIEYAPRLGGIILGKYFSVFI